MNLTWHIAKKDLRRVALPAGALVGFVLVTATWFLRVHLSAEAVAAHDELSWVNGISLVAAWTVGMQIVMSLLLAGYLALEDPVLGTTNFWQTRPIGRGRLLAAKAAASVVALVLAPTLALSLVWLTAGFGLGELARAAMGFGAVQMLLVLVALLFASLTRTIAEYFFTTLAAAVVFALAVAKPRAFGWGRELGANVEASRWHLVLGLSVAIAVLVTVHQFLTRRSRVGWVVLVAGIVAVHLVRVFWPRDLSAHFDAKASSPIVGAEAGPAVSLERISVGHSGQPKLAVRAAGGANGTTFAPQSGDVQLRWADGRTVKLGLKPGNEWGADAVRRLAGVKVGADPVSWEMIPVADVSLGSAAGAGPAISGKIALARVQSVMIGETPLRPGAQSRRGASGFRVVAINEGAGDERPTVVVEERDAWIRREPTAASQDASLAEDWNWEGYFLINRATGLVQGLRSVQLGSAELSKLLVRTRRLEFSWPSHDAAGRDGVRLIKVRFEGDRRLIRELSTDTTTLTTEEINR